MLPRGPRCRHCGSPLLLYSGEPYCANCTSFRPSHQDHGDHFLAPLLTIYQERHGLDDDALATLLGCPPYVLTLLRLCHRPAGAGRTSDEDIATISDRFGVDADALGRIVREVEG
jgi:hypothetical protein